MNNKVYLSTCDLLTSRKQVVPRKWLIPYLNACISIGRSPLEVSEILGHCSHMKLQALHLEMLTRKRETEGRLTDLQIPKSVYLGEKEKGKVVGYMGSDFG